VEHVIKLEYWKNDMKTRSDKYEPKMERYKIKLEKIIRFYYINRNYKIVIVKTIKQKYTLFYTIENPNLT